MNCEHERTTLVETRGLGSFSEVEIYRCDSCGVRIERDLATDTDGFAETEQDYDERNER